MTHDRDSLDARRGRQRSTVRRRRLSALSIVAAAIVLVAVVVAVAGGGSGNQSSAVTKVGGSGTGSAKDPKATAPTTTNGDKKSKAGVIDTSVARLAGGSPAPDKPVPILMYHVIGDPPSGAPYPDLYVSPDNFASQMTALDKKGYVAVTEKEVYDAWHDGANLPDKPIVISFDDGYQGIYKRALPVMAKLGWPGVLNLELKVLGQPEQGGLSPAQVKGLIDAGWEIASHTINHSDLTQVDSATVRSELVDSKAEIKRRFGVEANFFCYPAGKFDDAAVAAVEAAGYLGATTVDYGLARKDMPFTLSRIRINGSDGVDTFEARIDDATA